MYESINLITNKIEMNLNELRDKSYKNACEHGFHDQELSNEHCLCLVISELMEAVEADRKGKQPLIEQFNCGISYPKNNLKQVYDYCIKGTVAEELADACIRLLDLYGLLGIDLDEDAFDEETISEYSATYCNKSFTESIFHIIKFITSNNEVFIRLCVVPEILLLEIFGLAKYLSIDLMWHIEQKMKYNELREKMHGKKY